jgi:hypothetical protein
MGIEANVPDQGRGEKMKWTPLLFGSLAAALIAGCGGDRRNNETGAAGTAGSDSATMQGGTATPSDTAMSMGDSAGMSSDSLRSGTRMRMDTSRTEAGSRAAPTGKPTRNSGEGRVSNQTKSGVTDTKTGKSTLGKGVTQTRPDQGQPVTSKGDTVSGSPDSTSSNQ